MAGSKVTARVLAVTGSIGSGKSTFCRFLADMGAENISADVAAHEVLSFPEVVKMLVQNFGITICTSDGGIHTGRLAQEAFASAKDLKRLTSVVYPEIHRVLKEKITFCRSQNPSLIVLEAPTLFEAECDDLADVIVTVEALLPLRQERCSASRGWNADELERRDRFLLSSSERQRRSRYTIENNEGQPALKAAALKLYDEYCQQQR